MGSLRVLMPGTLLGSSGQAEAWRAELSTARPALPRRGGKGNAGAVRCCVREAGPEDVEEVEAGDKGDLIGREAVLRRGVLSAAMLATMTCVCTDGAEAAIARHAAVEARRRESLQMQTLQAAKRGGTRREIGKSAIGTAEWEYGNICGPGSWGSVCAAGRVQSPVNFELNKVQKGEKTMRDLVFDYGPVSPTFLNTGHGTMQVNFPGGRNKLKIGDRTLDLLQFHFHTPSEHSFNGVHHCMEAHLVHGDPQTKSLAVVGVLLDAKSRVTANRALQAALEYSPKEHYKTAKGPDNFSLSPALLLPSAGRIRKKRGYMFYQGSLTTPPCSEGVEWYVMETPVNISYAQVVEFMRYVGDSRTLALNTRPVQPLGQRTVFKGPIMA